jgi:phosphoglycolate phosphatase-like HAD superfamily hydrolase
MNKLADHFEKSRLAYPRDNLLIVFDIDGTILDMRHMILYVLKDFDEQLGTQYFQGLNFIDIDFHEAHVSGLLESLSIPSTHRKTILAFFDERLISATAFPESQRPFHGVLDVVRWFQGQPNTFVGLNTGRPESLRINTLETLNSWGRLHDVVFQNDLLYMRCSHDIESIAYAKVAGIDYFQQCGYRTFAFVDNEPDNLRAISDSDPHGAILLLHADTIFKSHVDNIPKRAVKGSVYDLRKLIAERRSQANSDDSSRIDFDDDYRRTA